MIIEQFVSIYFGCAGQSRAAPQWHSLIATHSRAVTQSSYSFPPPSYSLFYCYYFFFSFYFSINRHPPRAWMFIYAFHLMLIACLAPLPCFFFPFPLCKFTILFLLYGTSPFCYSFCLRPLTGRLLVGFITNGNYYWYKWCVTVRVCVRVWVWHEVRTAETTSKNLSHLQGDNSKEAGQKWERPANGREKEGNSPKTLPQRAESLLMLGQASVTRILQPSTQHTHSHTLTRTLDAVGSVTCVSQVY